MSRTVLKAAFLAGIVVSTAFSAAHAASPVKLGQLDCKVSDVEKTLFKTHLVLACSYVDVNGKNTGEYQAIINRTGLKIGNSDTTEFSWIVTTLGDVSDPKIAGTYFGAAAGASVGAGAGVNYLTGGFEGKISLQPWSVEGKSGLGLDLGGQKMELKEVPAS